MREATYRSPGDAGNLRMWRPRGSSATGLEWAFEPHAGQSETDLIRLRFTFPIGPKLVAKSVG